MRTRMKNEDSISETNSATVSCDGVECVPCDNDKVQGTEQKNGKDFREGRNGAGALLDMLAEVASQTLHSDPSMTFVRGGNSPQKKTVVASEQACTSANDDPDLSKDAALAANKRKRLPCRKSYDGDTLDLDQISNMSANLLLKLFAEFDGNEMRRTFTFICALDPKRCQQKFSSFGSELKSRQQMKSHLQEHVTQLLKEAADGMWTSKFTAESIQARQKRLAELASPANKKKRPSSKGSPTSHTKDGIKIKEEVIVKEEGKTKGEGDVEYILGLSNFSENSENQHVNSTSAFNTKPKNFAFASNCELQKHNASNNRISKPADYMIPKLRVLGHDDLYQYNKTKMVKSLSKDGCKSVLKIDIEKIRANEIASLDHNYSFGSSIYIQKAKEDFEVDEEHDSKQPSEQDEIANLRKALKRGPKDSDKSSETELNKFMVSEILHDMIMVCVVEDEKLHLKQLPTVGSEVDVKANDSFVCRIMKSEDLPVVKDNRRIEREINDEVMREMNYEKNIERDEYRQKKKPKGKAKFIGQSKAEKEMAIQLIESIKSKVTNLESLECHICNPPRTFTAPTTLISHYRSHAGIKPYECRICRAVFTRQHSLNYHMLIHSNQTRFTCSDCGRKFRHPSHFKEHQRRHTGESPYECSDCMLRFKTRNTYKRHLKTRHGKVLTTSGGLIILSEEEFKRVRTLPRSVVKQQPSKVFSKCKGSDPLKHKVSSRKKLEGYQNDSDGSHFLADGLSSSEQLFDSNGEDNSQSNDQVEEKGGDNEADKENAGSEETEETVPDEKTPVRKNYFEDIVKEAMRQSDISFATDPKHSESEECVSVDDVENIEDAPKINIKSSWNTVSVQVKPGANFTRKDEDDSQQSPEEDPLALSPKTKSIEAQVGKIICKSESPVSTSNDEQVTVADQKVLSYSPLLISQNGGGLVQQVRGVTVVSSDAEGSSYPHPLSIVTYPSVGSLRSEKQLKIIARDNTLIDALRSPAVVVMPEGDNLPFCPMSRRNFIIKDVGVVSGEPISLTQL